jgi:chorismate mutase / prephenate dehydratase
MQAVAPPLDDLRAEIDRIDEAMLELLIERSDVVRRIGEIKGDRRNGRLALRPGREAQVLRQLMAGAGTRFPHAVLVRMWRELIAAQTRLQTPLTVSVYTPRNGFAIWDLARDHFGSLTPMTRVDSASQAIRAAANGTAAVAVLPLPTDDDAWWPSVISTAEDRLRIFARLPFLIGAQADGEQASAFALGRVELEPSGDDSTLLVIEAEPDVSRGRLRDLLMAAELAPTWVAVWRLPTEPQALHLVEVASFVADGDERIGRLLRTSRSEVLRIVPLGGYPRPMTAGNAP